VRENVKRLYLSETATVAMVFRSEQGRPTQSEQHDAYRLGDQDDRDDVVL
jgi:hypothetical protein